MTNIYYGKNDKYEDGGWYGNDYYTEDELPLLNKFLKGMPTDLSVADNGELLCFMYSDMSISIHKELFDFSCHHINNAYKWSNLYESLFKNRVNIPEDSWIDIKYVFFNAMHNLPNYKLAVFANRMCQFIRKRSDVQDAIALRLISGLLNKDFSKAKKSFLIKDGIVNILRNNKEKLINEDTILVDLVILLYKKRILNDKLVNEAYELDEYEFTKDKEDLIEENKLFNKHLMKFIYDMGKLIFSDKYINRFIKQSYISILSESQSKRSDAFYYFINNIVLENLYNNIDPIDVNIKIKDEVKFNKEDKKEAIKLGRLLEE